MSHKTKTMRQVEAAERNERWAALDYVTKLDRLHCRPGTSARQRARIMQPTTDRIRERAAQRRTERAS